MNVYIKHRFLLLLPVLLGITFFTFVLMQLPADDTVDMMYKASGAVSETVKAAARAELGLDRPLLVRYLDWLLAVCSGDMGRSYISGTPVTALFVAKLQPTLYLTTLALLLTACISVPLGIAAALRHNRCCDHLIRCCAFLGNSLPGFFIALLLLYCFALKLNFFTVLGGSGFGGLLLPALALAIPMSAKYIRHIRSNILEEINRDYVTGALVRGISPLTCTIFDPIYFGTILRNQISHISPTRLKKFIMGNYLDFALKIAHRGNTGSHKGKRTLFCMLG